MAWRWFYLGDGLSQRAHLVDELGAWPHGSLSYSTLCGLPLRRDGADPYPEVGGPQYGHEGGRCVSCTELERNPDWPALAWDELAAERERRGRELLLGVVACLALAAYIALRMGA